MIGSLLEEATRLSDFIRCELLSLAILGLLSFSLWFFMTPSDSSAKGGRSWVGSSVPMDSAKTGVDVHYDIRCIWASYYYVV